MGKISVKHYFEKNVQPLEIKKQEEIIKLYPLYINVTTRRKVFKFKSQFYKFLDNFFDKRTFEYLRGNYIYKELLNDRFPLHRDIERHLEREKEIIISLLRIADDIPNELFSLKNFNEIFQLGTTNCYTFFTEPLISSKAIDSSIINTLKELKISDLFEIIDQSKPYYLIYEKIFFLLQDFRNHKEVVQRFNSLTEWSNAYSGLLRTYLKKQLKDLTIIEWISSEHAKWFEKAQDLPESFLSYNKNLTDEFTKRLKSMFLDITV